MNRNRFLFASAVIVILLHLLGVTVYAFWLEETGRETISDWMHANYGGYIAVGFWCGVVGFVFGHWAWPMRKGNTMKVRFKAATPLRPRNIESEDEA